MKAIVCFEVLMATIALWVALFGFCDVLVSKLEHDISKLAVYTVLAFFVLVFVYVNDSINMCTLM